MRKFAVLAALLFAAMACPAAPVAVDVGGTRLGVDVPPGFSDTGFTGSPRLQELAESLAPASNRILQFGLTDADLRAFMTSERPELRRYLVATTPRHLEREHVDAKRFSDFVADANLAFGTELPKDEATYRPFLDARTPGTSALLAELQRTDTVVSLLQGTRLPDENRSLFFKPEPRYLVGTTTLLLVRGRVLALSVYSNWDAPADLEWIRRVTGQWVADLRRLNAR